MPRWLSSLLITLGVLALIALALLPNSIVVNVHSDVNNVENVHHETTINHNHAAPAKAPKAQPTEQPEAPEAPPQ